MANLFDEIKETEPATIIAGDTLQFKRADLGADYPPADHTLTYEARLEGAGATKISITAAADGTDYVIDEAVETTAAYTVGRYHWSAFLTRTSDSKRITIDHGTWNVAANNAAASDDPRSHNKIVLDAIQAVIENRATKDQESYQIENRSLARTPLAELTKFEATYLSRVNRERVAERARRGKSTRRKYLVKF